MRTIAYLLIALIHALADAQSIVVRSSGGGTHQTTNVNKINEAPPRSPFLSTTLSTTITYSSPPPSLQLDTARKSIFTEALGRFLTKIFDDQQVYDLKIVSVNIFDDHVLHRGVEEELSSSNKRRKSNGDDDTHQKISFSTVVAAEYTEESQIDSIAGESYRKMLVHVCDKFQGHLLKYVDETGDPYFANVISVALGDFERLHGTNENGGNKVFGMEEDTMNLISIVAISVGGVMFVVFAFASIKYYR